MPTCAAKKKMAELGSPGVWEQRSRQLLDLWLVWATFDSEEELKQVLRQGKRKQCEKDRHVSAFTLSSSTTLLVSYWAADGACVKLCVCVLPRAVYSSVNGTTAIPWRSSRKRLSLLEQLRGCQDAWCPGLPWDGEKAHTAVCGTPAGVSAPPTSSIHAKITHSNVALLGLRQKVYIMSLS